MLNMDLGRRIKYYRERNGISQFDLEIRTNIAQGALSRIENGLVEPKRETITIISKALELGLMEQDYLIGQTSYPATVAEIEKAIEESNVYLSKRGVLAYLLDDRWRFYNISNTFKKILRIKPEEYDYVIGKTTVQVIVREDSPVLSRIDQDHYKELLASYLPFYFAFMSFMNDDVVFKETVEDINKNPISRKIWSKLTYESTRNFVSQEHRVIHFNIFGYKFPLYYSLEPLIKNSRFMIVEYTTKNKILDLIPQLL